MSEKRYRVIDDDFSKWVVDTTLTEDKHEGTLYTAYDMCKELNQLNNENEQLRQELQKWEEYVSELAKIENDNLKKDYLSCEKYNSLLDENEQLKQEIRAYPINEQYAEEIIQQNQKLRIEKNDLRRENERLRKQMRICQQSKNDDGRFQVWEVPPLKKGERISISTTNESGRYE